jgi:hypothetical protein
MAVRGMIACSSALQTPGMGTQRRAQRTLAASSIGEQQTLNLRVLGSIPRRLTTFLKKNGTF